MIVFFSQSTLYVIDSIEEWLLSKTVWLPSENRYFLGSKFFPFGVEHFPERTGER